MSYNPRQDVARLVPRVGCLAVPQRVQATLYDGEMKEKLEIFCFFVFKGDEKAANKADVSTQAGAEELALIGS